MLSRFVNILIAGAVLCGCGDSPGSGAPENEKSAPPIQPDSVSSEPRTTPVSSDESNGTSEAVIEGQFIVDHMELAAPLRANQLANRLQQAARENQGWFLEYTRKAEPGEPLPYDSRLGLTESEYAEFLLLSRKLTARKQQESTLIIKAKDDNVFVLDGGQALSNLTGIEIDLRNDLVRTPFGVLDELFEINANERSALGSWTGMQWKLEKPGPNFTTGTIVKFAIGTLKQSGRRVIYYDVKKIAADGNTVFSHILNYDVP